MYDANGSPLEQPELVNVGPGGFALDVSQVFGALHERYG